MNVANLKPFRLADLERVITERARLKPEDSYTVQLLEQGVEKCAKKLGEEAVELGLAALNPEATKAQVIGEAADLAFHFLVLLCAKEISLDELYTELRIRHEQMSESRKANARGT